MKQIEKLKAAIKWATDHAKEGREARNACQSVIICAESIIESCEMYKEYGFMPFNEGVIFGKVAFYTQILLIMFYHFGIYDLSCCKYEVDAQTLIEEVRGVNK